MPLDRPLLRAAQAALEQDDLRRANGLFLEHLAQSRDDGVALAEYGGFCLRSGRYEAACYLLDKASRLLDPDAGLLDQLGYARLENHDLEGARQGFESALALDPRDALANYGLGQCNQQADAWPQAVEAFERAVSAQPDALPMLLNLAEACHHAGDMERASACFARAEQLAADDPAMLLAYGRFLRETGSFAQAMQKLGRLARAHPDEPPVILETARCLRAMGDCGQATLWLEKFNRLAPGTAEYNEELGNCAAALNDGAKRDLHWGQAADQWVRNQQFSLAEPLLEKMAAANPRNVVTWILKGGIHAAQQQLDLAKADYEQAIKTDPKWPDGYANLANLHEQTNLIPQAKAVATTGLAMAAARNNQPRNSVVSLLMSSCKCARRQKDYPHAMQLLDRMSKFVQYDLERQLMAFERGKVLDLMGDEAGAIAAFAKGNALALAPWIKANPGENTYVRGIDYLLGLIRNGWLKDWPRVDPQNSETDPAFLVGFPRSGTTLLNQILFCHDAIQIAEEKNLVQAMRDSVRSMPKGYPLSIPELDSLDVAYLRDVYFRTGVQHGVVRSSKLLVDKLPLHVTTAGLIHRVFPKARFVFAVRHPCDVVLSCFMQDFRANEAMANFHSIADTVRLYTKTMDLWMAYREQLALDVHMVRYEDVVDDFDTQVRGLCDFLGIAWDESLRQFSTKALDRGRINTPSYEQVSKPIYREALNRWERYRKYLEPHLPALQPYIERFGYADPAQPDQAG